MVRRIAALSLELTGARQAVRLLPAGVFRSADGSGRPTDAPHWRLDAAAAAALIARFNARRDDRVIDYEHSTLTAAAEGRPAIAAGWFKTLEWREPSADEPGGLYATDVRWTPQAGAMLASQEYRYLSPVFRYDQDGTVLELAMAGLTNTPGLDGLTDLAALSARFFSTHEETPVNELLKKLLLALGLPDTTSEADALAALSALKSQAGEQETQLAALRAAPPDPAKYVPVGVMADLQTQVAALTAQLNQGESARLIEAALADGRLLPAQKQWATELGKTNLAALTSYLAATPVNPALAGTQTQGAAPSGAGQGGSQPTEALAVMRALGLTAEQFAAGKFQEA